MAPTYLQSLSSMNLSTVQSTGSYYEVAVPAPEKIESKKEKIARIAKEKMLASWKSFDQKTPTIIKIKQICKPHHRINFSGRRF